MLWQSTDEISDASSQSFVDRVIDSEDRAVASLMFSSEFNRELSLFNLIKLMNDEYFTTYLIRWDRK